MTKINLYAGDSQICTTSLLSWASDASIQLSTLYTYFECVSIYILNSVSTLNRHLQFQMEFLVSPPLPAFPISLDGNSILPLAQIKLSVSSLFYLTLCQQHTQNLITFYHLHCYNPCLPPLLFTWISAIDPCFAPLPLHLLPLIHYS